MSENPLLDRPEPPARLDMPPLNNLPQEALEAWVRIPSDRELEGGLTRQAIDELYFSIREIHNALLAFQESMAVLSRGEAEVAQVYFDNAKAHGAVSYNHLVEFMGRVMEANKGLANE